MHAGCTSMTQGTALGYHLLPEIEKMEHVKSQLRLQ